jgi:Aminoglycoside-2''-adenylyltransferase
MRSLGLIEMSPHDSTGEGVANWDPMSPHDAAECFASVSVPWWISGGWAIDLFLDRETRPQDELDFEAVIPRLSREARNWLQQSLVHTLPSHPWTCAIERHRLAQPIRIETTQKAGWLIKSLGEKVFTMFIPMVILVVIKEV